MKQVLNDFYMSNILKSFAFVFYTFFSIEHEEDSEEQSINNKG